jgi:hypothetical protein
MSRIEGKLWPKGGGVPILWDISIFDAMGEQIFFSQVQ